MSYRLKEQMDLHNQNHMVCSCFHLLELAREIGQNQILNKPMTKYQISK
jgi:hypothetical protein